MKELMKIIGKKGKYNIDGFVVDVEVTDAKVVFGRTDYQIKPVCGSGSKWVESSSIKVG